MVEEEIPKLSLKLWSLFFHCVYFVKQFSLSGKRCCCSFHCTYELVPIGTTVLVRTTYTYILFDDRQTDRQRTLFIRHLDFFFLPLHFSKQSTLKEIILQLDWLV